MGSVAINKQISLVVAVTDAAKRGGAFRKL